MSTTPQPESEEHRSLRRLLKELPKVEASSDFEMRLERKLREGEASSAPEKAGRNRPFALPAFATSLLALLVVGLLSYYTFFRNTTSPVMPDAVTPAPQLTAPPATPEQLSPLPSVKEKKVESSVSREGVVAPAPAPARSEPAAKSFPKRSEAEENVPAVVPAEKDAGERRDEAVPPSPVEEAPAVKAADEAAPPAAAPQPSILRQLQEQIVPDSSGKELQVRARQLREAAQIKGMFAFPQGADTSVRIDSSAVDSLRRFEKLLRDPARRPKPRRPNQ